MIDTHCHFDIMDNPFEYINRCEHNKLITIGMTNLPSHFKMGINHVRKYKYIRLALGLHPLLANEHEKEYNKFKQLINETSYIGEIGLDFSREGFSTRDMQIKSFEFVLDTIKEEKKILNLHTRRAEKETLEMLNTKGEFNAIFHWYSGSVGVLDNIIDSGYYLSVNSAMLSSENGKRIIHKIPKELILTETDAPYIAKSNIGKVHNYLSKLWDITPIEVEKTITNNFKALLQKIK